MSSIPFFLGYDYPRRVKDFDLDQKPDEFLMAGITPMLSRDYYRPWHKQPAATRDVSSSVRVDEDKYTLNLDVQHFGPGDLSVRATEGYIVVIGQHKEKQDEHGFIARKFKRRYVVPGGCDLETVECKLSSDGVLTVIAPRHKEANTERLLSISQFGNEGTDQDSQASDNESLSQ